MIISDDTILTYLWWMWIKEDRYPGHINLVGEP